MRDDPNDITRSLEELREITAREKREREAREAMWREYYRRLEVRDAARAYVREQLATNPPENTWWGPSSMPRTKAQMKGSKAERRRRWMAGEGL